MTIKYFNKGKYILVFTFGLLSNYFFSQQIADDAIQTSIINLVSSPEKYDNKKVIIKGFLFLEKESYNVYLTKDDLKYRNTKNSIFLLISYDVISNLHQQKLNGKYVEVLGEYVVPKKESFQRVYKSYGGVLKNIEDIHKVDIINK
ncbi:hypothetical protein [Chryseobacterium arthrosphaerae]|uniref:hypothetical protein n=1 Tax=Chryseobacterium arthrosphaerae TaxID=651561 RepID=UPI001F4A9187|nr:hypothetical protein [Chryseobacterium arthrosphaerae]